MDHTQNGAQQEGQYFSFWQSDANAILGSYGHGSIHLVDQYRNGAKIIGDSNVVLKTSSYGSIGDGGGRFDPAPSSLPGQWKIGDYFCFSTGIGLF